MIPYGKRLIELRGEKSQEEAAKDIGIATSTLGMYEQSGEFLEILLKSQ